MVISYSAFGAFSIMSIPLFGIGVYSSIYKKKKYLSIPLSVWLLVIYAGSGLLLYMLTYNSLFAHIFVNSVVMVMVLYTMFLLNKFTPVYKMSPFYISATYLLYIIHMKVLSLMIVNWGYVSFWSWAITVIIITIFMNRIKIWSRI